MQYVFVLNRDKTPLAPCSPERAKKLMSGGRAAMYRMYPFTIIMRKQVEVTTTPPSFFLKLDPGASTTGIAIVRNDKEGSVVVWAAELTHKGFSIKTKLQDRRAIRSNRRSRKTRYRKPGFKKGVEASFGREEGWLPPSLMSRVDNIVHWTGKLIGLCPISQISYELVKFDTQLMENPDISGIEYQQGTLAGYEIREYLLEKWDRKCAYCKKSSDRLEIEHINPRSRGGGNRVTNLCIACHGCNQRKGNKTASEFGYPAVQDEAKKGLKDAAAINSIRWRVYNELKSFGLPIEIGSGGLTKMNRFRQGYEKSHWVDAACVGKSGELVKVLPGHKPLLIKAMGRGSRLSMGIDKYGVPSRKPKIKEKRASGFSTGDFIRHYDYKTGEVSIGRVLTGGVSPELRTKEKPRLSIKKKDRVVVIQYNDGYNYSHST